MRKKRNPQCSMELHYVPHEICSQLFGILQWLNAHPQFNDWIYDDLSSGDKQNTEELSFNKFPISVHPELSKGRATELRQAQSERSQAMKIGKLFPDNS